jgi:hypothetical protein
MTLKDQVKQILSDYPYTRNNDIALMIKLWGVYYSSFYNELIVGGDINALYKLPYQDNIKRYRARLQAKGQYLPTDREVIKQRRINEYKWRKELGLRTYEN